MRATFRGQARIGEGTTATRWALVYSEEKAEEVVALDDALRRLDEIDPRQSRIVELRFFGGLSVDETAEVMGISQRTVKREWSVARLWLHRQIANGA
jgi:RNA polymerase sigma factor (TIGR02999 family)